MFVQHIAGLSGLAAAVLFIFGLKRMSSPVTALSGIVVAGLGMVVAVAVSFWRSSTWQRPSALILASILFWRSPQSHLAVAGHGCAAGRSK